MIPMVRNIWMIILINRRLGYNNQKSYMYIRILSAKDTNFTVGNTL